MANIIERAYDASKMIVRAVFKGAPNLFTTSDINRQIESLKRQIDFLEDKLGYITTEHCYFEASVSSDGTALTVNVYSDDEIEDGGEVFPITIYVRGVKYSFPESLYSLRKSWSTSANRTVYVVLRATTKEVTFEDDPSHEVSGATFEDGATAASADHIVFENFTLDLIENDGVRPSDVVAVLAEVKVRGANKPFLQVFGSNNNSKDMYNRLSGSAFAEARNHIHTFYGSESSAPAEGITYDSALSYLARCSVPVGTILPFYGDVLSGTPYGYGWVPCVPLAKGELFASVSDFADNAAYKALKGMYSNRITFEVVTLTEFSYLRVSRCHSVDIPNLAGKFLTGAGAIGVDNIKTVMYTLGTVGGESRHRLSESELPAHSHSAQVDYLKVAGKELTWNETGSGAKGYLNDHDYGPDINWGDSTPTHSHTVTIGNTGGNEKHENRPPFHAVYYIMRVV